MPEGLCGMYVFSDGHQQVQVGKTTDFVGTKRVELESVEKTRD
jgi:hypothetical protein